MADSGERLDPLSICDQLVGPNKRYVVDDYQGRGGYGYVYRARIRETNTGVALKILMPEFVAHKDAKRRFEHEAKAAKGVKGVPAYLDYFEDRFRQKKAPRLPCIAMSWIEGQRLSELLKNKGGAPLGERAAVEIAFRVSEILLRLHTLNTFHRDVKPDNIMVEEEEDGRWQVHLVDFGNAKTVDPSSGTAGTETGHLPHTPGYRNVRALELKQEKTGRTDQGELRDVTALGLTLYHMLLGNLLEEPFPITADDPVFRDIPCLPATRALVARTIIPSQVVDLRMAELRLELRSLMQVTAKTEAMLAEDDPAEEFPDSSRPPWRRLALIGAAAAALVGATALVWRVGSDQAPPVATGSATPVRVDAAALDPRPPPPLAVETARLMTNTEEQLFGVTADSAGRVWAVGDKGPIRVSTDNGDHWKPDKGALTNWLYGAWTDGIGHAYFVGARGAIIRWPRQNKVLLDSSSNTTETLMGIWGSSPHDIYAVGDKGTIRHSTDGRIWARETVPEKDGLRAVWGSGPDDVWIVGWDGAIFHKAGSRKTRFERISIGTDKPWFYGVWGSGSDDLYIVGAPCQPPEKGERSRCPNSKAIILHSHDGFKSRLFTTIERDETDHFTAVWGRGPNDVYVTGNNGVILHSADGGETWGSAVENDEGGSSSVKFSSIHGGAAGVTFFAGSRGTILRRRAAPQEDAKR